MRSGTHSAGRTPTNTTGPAQTVDKPTLIDLLLRFARYLDCEGQRLNDRQILLLVMVCSLRGDRTLRLSNLPMRSPIRTLENDLKFLRGAGLVFTTRAYYPAVNGNPPRLRAVTWDLRSLEFNLLAIQRLWRQRCQAVSARTGSTTGRKPVAELPGDFRHAVVVPGPVLNDIREGRFYPVPDKWLRMSTNLGPLHSPDSGQPAAADEPRPIDALAVETPPPTHADSAGHRLTHTTQPGLERPREPVNEAQGEEVFRRFAWHKGTSYTPTGRDRQAVQSLLADGYTTEEIIQTIDRVFARGDDPQRFAYCARIVRDLSPARPRSPNSRSAPPPASSGMAVELPAELQFLAARLCTRGRSRLDVSQRVRQLREAFEADALRCGERVDEWLASALQLSLDRDDPLSYATAILRQWSANGRRRSAGSLRSAAAGKACATAPAWADAFDE